MTTDTETKQVYAVNDRVQIDPDQDLYPEVAGALATVTGYSDIFDEYKLYLDEVPKGYERYTWDTRSSWTLPARMLKSTDVPNPDPRPWPQHRRHTRVILKESNQIGTILATRPQDRTDADYHVALDNGRKVFVKEAEVERFDDEWKFNGIVHRVRVTPDHSGREGGGWLFMVNSGLNDSIGWVRADAAQALARRILGLPAEPGDETISDAVDI